MNQWLGLDGSVARQRSFNQPSSDNSALDLVGCVGHPLPLTAADLTQRARTIRPVGRVHQAAFHGRSLAPTVRTRQSISP